jgi:cellulose synthase/poly-beta-1,6-N-acetylglucosamine synthase-like glycosyltransferase
VDVSLLSPAPDVSVILSVRNGGSDLPKAIATILAQSFVNFELIAIDNGSTDETAAFLDSIGDSRVRVYHQADAGLAAALNRGISLARGRYIARQDHDDWALPTRIEQQVRFLDAHPDHALIGTCAEIWIGDRPTGRFHDHPAEDAPLRLELLFNNPFVHSSVMIRKSALDQIGGYTTDPERHPPEDYELWSRLARRFRIANLPERLTIYREVPSSMSRAGAHPFKRKLVMLSAENLAFATGLTRPEQIHIDMAALVHDLPDILSRESDIAAMCEVLADAGRRISGRFRTADVDVRVARWQRQLQRRFHAQNPVIKGVWKTAVRIRGGLRRLGLLKRG